MFLFYLSVCLALLLLIILLFVFCLLVFCFICRSAEEDKTSQSLIVEALYLDQKIGKQNKCTQTQIRTEPKRTCPSGLKLCLARKIHQSQAPTTHWFLVRTTAVIAHSQVSHTLDLVRSTGFRILATQTDRHIPNIQ